MLGPSGEGGPNAGMWALLKGFGSLEIDVGLDGGLTEA